MAVVTAKGLLELLGKEADHWDLVASSPVVTEDGMDQLLGKGLGRTPYSFENRIKTARIMDAAALMVRAATMSDATFPTKKSRKASTSAAPTRCTSANSSAMNSRAC